MNEQTVVAARATKAQYPSIAPFHPSRNYREYAFGQDRVSTAEANFVYDTVRNALYLAGLDRDRFDTPQWNPLAQFVRPGQFVLLKPNLVKELHPRDPAGWQYTITHGSVIRAVADYVWKALDGRGRVMLADGPQTDSSFAAVVERLELRSVQEFYRQQGLDLELVDLRKEEWTTADDVTVERRKLPGDPHGYLAFDLADHSEFFGHRGEGRYYGADYDCDELNRHHSGGKHEYLIAGSAIHCDVLINLPKMKTHKKAGITVNLKNLVGVNGDKNWLPHHTVGSPENGGDQFPHASVKHRVEHLAARSLRKLALRVPGLGTWVLRRVTKRGKALFGDTTRVVRSGNWHGNDTTWRMCLDLNKVVLYGDTTGKLREAELNQRKTYLSFVDGIVAGQGDGPMNPDPYEAGIILFGSNAANTDACAGVLMGFNLEQIPIVRNAFHARYYPLVANRLEDIQVLSNVDDWNGRLADIARSNSTLSFRPHFGWVGHMERERPPLSKNQISANTA